MKSVQRILIVLAIFCLLTPTMAALPPFYQSVLEIESILYDKDVIQEMREQGYIVLLIYDEGTYTMVTHTGCQLDIGIDYKDTAEFELNVGEPNCESDGIDTVSFEMSVQEMREILESEEIDLISDGGSIDSFSRSKSGYVTLAFERRRLELPRSITESEPWKKANRDASRALMEDHRRRGFGIWGNEGNESTRGFKRQGLELPRSITESEPWKKANRDASRALMEDHRRRGFGIWGNGRK